MSDEPAIIAELKVLIEVTREGLRENREELQALRKEFKSGEDALWNRIRPIEEFMFSMKGTMTFLRTLAGASFLGAVLSVVVALSR